MSGATREPLPPLPAGTGKFFLQAFGALLAIGALVTWIVLSTRGERDAVRSYVDRLTAGDLPGAYALVSSQRRRELTFEQWSEAMHTPALRQTEDLTIARTRTSSGRGCVGTVVEVAGAGTLRVSFLTLDEQDRVWIHDVLTHEEYRRESDARAAGWSCEQRP
jgi:hypothetical protein